jgi:hypothetical protein
VISFRALRSAWLQPSPGLEAKASSTGFPDAKHFLFGQVLSPEDRLFFHAIRAEIAHYSHQDPRECFPDFLNFSSETLGDTLPDVFEVHLGLLDLVRGNTGKSPDEWLQERQMAGKPVQWQDFKIGLLRALHRELLAENKHPEPAPYSVSHPSPSPMAPAACSNSCSIGFLAVTGGFSCIPNRHFSP